MYVVPEVAPVPLLFIVRALVTPPAEPVVFWFRVGISAATIERREGIPVEPFGVAQNVLAEPDATVDEYKELTALSPVFVPEEVPECVPDTEVVPVTVSAPVPPFVIVTPLIDVAVATPNVGVTNVGLVVRATFPVPDTP